MATDKDTNVPNKTDYISREAALETINDILSPYGPNGDAISKTVAYCEINAIPAADVRPAVQAQWEQVMGKYDFLVRCNKCHYIPIDDLKNMNFCPNCGASMREAGDG